MRRYTRMVASVEVQTSAVETADAEIQVGGAAPAPRMPLQGTSKQVDIGCAQENIAQELGDALKVFCYSGPFLL